MLGTTSLAQKVAAANMMSTIQFYQWIARKMDNENLAHYLTSGATLWRLLLVGWNKRECRVRGFFVPRKKPSWRDWTIYMLNPACQPKRRCFLPRIFLLVDQWFSSSCLLTLARYRFSVDPSRAVYSFLGSETCAPRLAIPPSPI